MNDVILTQEEIDILEEYYNSELSLLWEQVKNFNPRTLIGASASIVRTRPSSVAVFNPAALVKEINSSMLSGAIPLLKFPKMLHNTGPTTMNGAP